MFLSIESSQIERILEQSQDELSKYCGQLSSWKDMDPLEKDFIRQFGNFLLFYLCEHFSVTLTPLISSTVKSLVQIRENSPDVELRKIIAETLIPLSRLNCPGLTTFDKLNLDNVSAGLPVIYIPKPHMLFRIVSLNDKEAVIQDTEVRGTVDPRTLLYL